MLPGDRPAGFSIEVFEDLSERLGYTVNDYRAYPSVQAALDAVAAGKVDIAVGPLSITSERARAVHFTQPYYAANVGILAPASPPSALDRIRPFLSSAFLFGLTSLIIILLVVGAVIWMAERGKNDDFPASPAAGIGAGMWFALVTMTTVGYGDKAPRTLVGRLITSVWMVVAMITASSLTAGIATALTLSQIDGAALNSLNELRGHPVVAVTATPGVAIARQRGARLREAPDMAAALKILERGEADAFIYDYPVLKHHLDQHGYGDYTVVKTEVSSEDYGFAVATGSPLRAQADIELLTMREARIIKTLARKWLGE